MLRGRTRLHAADIHESCRWQVITDQPYIPQLVRSLEAQGIRPVPVFINGASW